MSKVSRYGRPTYQYKRRLGGRTRKTTVTILDTHIEQMELMIEKDSGSISGIVGDALDMYLSNHSLIVNERVKDVTKLIASFVKTTLTSAPFVTNKRTSSGVL